MLRRLVVLLIVGGVVGVVVHEIAPDVRRYIKLRNM
jgi:hypothetical protein